MVLNDIWCDLVVNGFNVMVMVEVGVLFSVDLLVSIFVELVVENWFIVV